MDVIPALVLVGGRKVRNGSGSRAISLCPLILMSSDPFLSLQESYLHLQLHPSSSVRMEKTGHSSGMVLPLPQPWGLEHIRLGCKGHMAHLPTFLPTSLTTISTAQILGTQGPHVLSLHLISRAPLRPWVLFFLQHQLRCCQPAIYLPPRQAIHLRKGTLSPE